jgi:hypothetical protein
MVIIVFRAINDRAVIDKLFSVAGYTYGPLLGMYAFGLFTRKKVIDRFVPVVAILSPVLCYIFNEYSQMIFPGYQVGFELLLYNGGITFLGLLILAKGRE